MPNSLQTLDTSFPKADSHQTAEENLNKVTNYLYMLLENLKYTLGNAVQDGNLNELNVTSTKTQLEIIFRGAVSGVYKKQNGSWTSFNINDLDKNANYVKI